MNYMEIIHISTYIALMVLLCYLLIRWVKMFLSDDICIGDDLFDYKVLSLSQKIKAFYIQMILEAIFIVMLCSLGAASRNTDIQKTIHFKMWRGNWIFPLFIIILVSIIEISFRFINKIIQQ